MTVIRMADMGSSGTTKKVCRDCRWRSDEFASVCVNADSSKCTDFVDADDSCTAWEEHQND